MMDHGTRRRLQRLTTSGGHFCVAAVDHRDSMLAEFPNSATPADLTAFKADVITALQHHASAVMIEPEYSFPHLTDNGTVPPNVGVICALEAQGYRIDVTRGDPSIANQLMDGWSARLLLESGADAAKLLVLYRPDDGEVTAAQDNLVRTVVEACAKLQLPVLVEPVPYDLVSDTDRADVVVRSVERLASFGPMVLKVPYPGAGACNLVDEAAGDLPWALLSWGVTFEVFREQLSEACQAGASGFMVGRALWREAVAPETRAEILAGTVVERFEELSTIAAKGTPWFERLGPPATNWPWAKK